MVEVKKISGIYNYCNRWCERCDFTNRCDVALRESESKKNEVGFSEKDIWETVHDHLKEAFNLLKEMMKEMDAEDISPFEAKEESLDILSNEITTNDLSTHESQFFDFVNKKAKEYGIASSKWFSENADFLEQKESELNQLLDIGARDIVKEAHLLKEAILTVRWNMFLIGAKLNRAISGMTNPDQDDQAIQNDSNGSAKVALIAIEDSLAAWNVIRDKIPELADDLLDMLVRLVRLQKKSIKAFPVAHKFKRPGFDDDL